VNIRRIAAVSILASAAVTGTAAADTNATPTVPIQSISVSVPRPSQPVTVTSRQLDSKIGTFAHDPIVPGCPTIGILPTIDANSPAAAEPLYQYLIMWSELPPTCHTVS
jgi:hypothetical protein